MKFKIATPGKVVFSDEVLQVVIPTKSGEVTILSDHIPLVSVLDSGVIEAKKEDGSIIMIAVSGGMVEVKKDAITVLADTAERAEDLDEERIIMAREKAQKIKESARVEEEEEFFVASAKIAKEMAREKALQKWRRLSNTNKYKQ